MVLIASVLVHSAAVWLVVRLVDGVDFITTGTVPSWGVILIAGLLFSIINLWVKPVAKLLSLPLYLLTLGLFGLIINAFMFLLVAWLSAQIGEGVTVSGLVPALIGGVIMAIATGILNSLLPRRLRRRH